MHVAINVDNPDLWRSSAVLSALVKVLSFVTEDKWDFSFSSRKLDETSQLQMFESDGQLAGNPGCVSLFSSGADSLCAAVEAHGSGLNPLLVSHRPSPSVGRHQDDLIEMLRTRSSDRYGFRQVAGMIHRRGKDPIETSQRTRSFLFGSLALAAASSLKVWDVRMSDNGVVSVNLPLTAGVVGAQASRSTHPLFLRLFEQLARTVFGSPFEVSNPFWNKTRAETLEVLKAAGWGDLISATYSCAHPRGRTRQAPHCGACSQCVDRRFGMLAAGLAEYDLAERYELDIFRDPLAEGEARTIATSYVRLALRLEKLDEDGILTEFQELQDCIDWESAAAMNQAFELSQMLRRHARSALDVLRDQVVAAADRLVRGELPSTCLVRLSPLEDLPTPFDGDQRAITPPPEPRGLSHAEDFATVSWLGETYSLGPDARTAFSRLHEAGRNGHEISGSTLLADVQGNYRSVSELFRRSGLWQKLVIKGRIRGNYRVTPEAM
jgi:7-cyano-7-deazaguanine synthase in queuosine biosynthesis